MPGRLSRLNAVDTGRTTGAPRPRLKPRGLPPALEPHGVYVATNPAEASVYGRDLLGSHRIHVAGDDIDAFEATFHGVLVRDVTLGYLDYSTPVRVEVHELPEDHLVIVPASGTSRVTIDGEDIECSPVTAAIPATGSAFSLECDFDTAHLVVRIAHTALDVHLSRLLGRSLDEPLRFDPQFDLTAGPSSRWNFAVQMLHAELLERDSLLRAGQGLGQMEEFLMSSLLYCQPSNYSEKLVAGRASIRPSVRAAQEYIEQRLAVPLTVDEIATAGEMSVRTLQSHFREDLGHTVTGYLRDRRLERARADLADSSPAGGVTVTEIASRWGFNHLGRFAVMYRTRFGESPSQTLRT